MRITSVERVEATHGELAERLAAADRPLVITGAIHDWPAMKWTPEALRDRFGALRVSINVADMAQIAVKGTARPVEMTLGECVDHFTSGRGASAEGMQQGLCQPLPQPGWHAVLAEVRLPPFVDQRTFNGTAFWMSGRGNATPLHYDGNGCQNFNAQILGRKRALLFSPDQIANLYPRSIHVDEEACWSQVVDVLAPDLTRFPKLNDTTCVEAVLEAGDLLFIPPLWFHSFVHEGHLNVNVNVWSRPQVYRPSPTLWHWALVTAIRYTRGSDPSLQGAPVALHDEVLSFLSAMQGVIVGTGRYEDYFETRWTSGRTSHPPRPHDPV